MQSIVRNSDALTGISSMATRQLLAELLAAFAERSGVKVAMESVGGVDAARRVLEGEQFDVVVLASDAIDKLIAAGRLDAGSKRDLVHSGVAMAVASGTPVPELDTADAVRDAILAARSIGYSTGPSGVQMEKLLHQWGIYERVADRAVKAPAGVPVAELVKRGEVELGFQQLSELLNIDGITVLGELPGEIQITTTFSAARGLECAQAGRVEDLLNFLCSDAAKEAKLRQGMRAVPAGG